MGKKHRHNSSLVWTGGRCICPNGIISSMTHGHLSAVTKQQIQPLKRQAITIGFRQMQTVLSADTGLIYEGCARIMAARNHMVTGISFYVYFHLFILRFQTIYHKPCLTSLFKENQQLHKQEENNKIFVAGSDIRL